MLRSIDRLSAVVTLALFAGCAHVGETLDADELGPGQKIIVGEVLVEGGDFDQWVPGGFHSALLLLDYELPIVNRKVRVTPLAVGKAAFFVPPQNGGPRTDPQYERNGGAFRIAIDNRNAYLLSVRVRSRVAVVPLWTDFPLYVWIQPSERRCEYIGSVVVRQVNDQTFVRVEDNYEQFTDDNPKFVARCRVYKGLATVLTPEQIRAYEARLPPPRFEVE
jgi:hypothetical protein